MKKNLYFILSMTAMLLLAACDDIALEDRLTYVEPPVSSRAVLIEDFTGQYCVNCPKATEEIERLMAEYGDTSVIAVAIHSGPFSKLKGEPTPLYTSIGDEYFNHWGLSSQPVGVLDRLGAFDYMDWGAGVNYEISQETPVSLYVSAYADMDTRETTVYVDMIGLDSETVKGKLQVWLVEDSIESFQLMPDGSRNEHYNHMHVFRTAVNGLWGEDVSVNHGEVYNKEYAIKLDDAWDPMHCSFVVFLYDETGVKQVTKAHVEDIN